MKLRVMGMLNYPAASIFASPHADIILRAAHTRKLINLQAAMSELLSLQISDNKAASPSPLPRKPDTPGMMG